MARLNVPMPRIAIPEAELREFGNKWTELDGRLSRTPPASSAQLGRLFEEAVGQALAQMLGGIRSVYQSGDSLVPIEPDCVE